MKRTFRRFFLTLTCLSALGGALFAQTPPSGPTPVRLEQREPGKWELLRDGKPYFIKGAGGSTRLELLAQSGGNSIRTWGADGIGPLLDKAQSLGLTVTVGIWFGHLEHGFKYDDPKQVAAQQERVRQAVLRYRKHPAVLIWALGNEMEGYKEGGDPLIWKAVQDAAHLVKELDPDHPTMTVIAEIGGQRVPAIHKYCPDIDIIGINSYAGAPSIPARYKAAGGVKPFVLTEFGPAGTWESGKNAWGATPEPTSTEKAKSYRTTYETAIKNQPLCLGGYAFTWGSKQEATATWFGMLLPDGSKLGAVDAMTEAWTGKPPANRCPEIVRMAPVRADRVKPQSTVKVALEANDPEGKPLNVRWVLQQDPMQESLNGDHQAAPPIFPEAIVHEASSGAEVKMPAKDGAYRLFAYVTDGDGGAAVANVPLLVDSRSDTAIGQPGATVKLPFVVYEEKDGKAPYAPSGFMGKREAIRLDEECTTLPHGGKTCIRCEFTDPGEWGGVVWQNPVNDWGDLMGGYDLRGASKLTFWAKGQDGGEKVEFQFGLLDQKAKFPDSANGKLPAVTLTREWTQYSIDLRGKDLSRIKTGFCWVVAGQGKPTVFYLDDIRFE